MQKKKEGSGVAPRQEPLQLKAIQEVEEVAPEVEEKQTTMETEKVESATEKPVEVAPKKKKGKKKSYKNLMASMVHTEPTKDIEKEKEALRKVTGGGVFSKIDKI
jgi:predicted ATP-dependent serine protease